MDRAHALGVTPNVQHVECLLQLHRWLALLDVDDPAAEGRAGFPLGVSDDGFGMLAPKAAERESLIDQARKSIEELPVGHL